MFLLVNKLISTLQLAVRPRLIAKSRASNYGGFEKRVLRDSTGAVRPAVYACDTRVVVNFLGFRMLALTFLATATISASAAALPSALSHLGPSSTSYKGSRAIVDITNAKLIGTHYAHAEGSNSYSYSYSCLEAIAAGGALNETVASILGKCDGTNASDDSFVCGGVGSGLGTYVCMN